jgi:hypothetical protein
MRKLTIALVFLVAATLGYWTTTFAQTNHTYTCSWTHDGAGTDSYTITVDGVATVTGILPSACSGTPPARVCTAPLTMTQNVPHTVVVEAVNVFGMVASSPFPASPPSSQPLAVTVK